MRVLTLAVMSCLALSACKKVDGPDAGAMPEVKVGELSEATMKDVTKALSSDAFEGRAPGGVGEEKTVALTDREIQGRRAGTGQPCEQQGRRLDTGCAAGGNHREKCLAALDHGRWAGT